MTLTEFKSLLSSALTVPPGQEDKQDGGRPPLNWDSLREKAKSVRDSISTSSSISSRKNGVGGSSTDVISGRRSLPPSPMTETRTSAEDRPSSVIGDRPKTPLALRRNTNNSTAPGTPPLSRPKTPTSTPSRPKTPTSSYRSKTPVSENGQREEFKMSRPKTPSQIKRDAVAKVAGAISNWVDSRPEASVPQQRPKTPTRSRPFTPGAWKSEDFEEEDNDEIAGFISSPPLAHTVASAARERPETPSRIPKPCFTPRPETPKTDARRTPLSHTDPSRQKPSPASSQPSQQPAMSRSSSITSNVTSHDAMTPASDVSDDRSFASSVASSKSSRSKVVGVISRRQPSPSSATNGHNVSNGDASAKSYKDIHFSRRSITPGPGTSSFANNKPQPVARSTTPGPYERRNVPERNVSTSSAGSSSPNIARRPPLTKQRSLGNPTQGNPAPGSQKNSSVKGQSSPAPLRRAATVADVKDPPFMLTNEITFSDDEEINELVMNSAKMAAAQNSDNRVRSSSVDARKLARKNSKENGQNEVLMIKRDSSGNHGVQVVKQNKVKYDSSKVTAVKRPQSRGPSSERPALQAANNRFRSQTPDPTMFRQKKNTSRVKDCDDADINRTEAWVDSTLSDPKRKPPMRQKRPINIGKDIPASELKPRPLEEITALLSEPPNGLSCVDTEELEAPPEDPEMFRKMERLFEKYREMELRASVNETPGIGHQDGSRGGSQRSSNSLSTPSVTSLKTSSGSHSSSSGRSTNASNSRGGKSQQNNETHSSDPPGQFKRSSSVPGTFQQPLQKQKSFSSAGSAASTPCSETKNFVQRSQRRSASPVPDRSATSGIDGKVAKDPKALVSKIKEILKVHPRKDEVGSTPTRIPAPASLGSKTRSKSVSNLFSEDSQRMSVSGAAPDSRDIDPSRLQRSSSSSSGNIAYSEVVFDGDVNEMLDEVGDVMPRWSVDSSSDNRSETPVPKLATPLITGRSTFINRRGDRNGRALSQEKENYLSNSQSSASSRSMFSTTEDEGEYV